MFVFAQPILVDRPENLIYRHPLLWMSLRLSSKARFIDPEGANWWWVH